ncbi:hypothetical protein C0Q70_13601 [Pomacea canaliculata]|uniref:Uncharacterized protein n=1 Tax=Pomacea canaliculata TaxID=400727 RepID=A0A2T7NXQ6_POMCA|nr:hypothetical protein C0Q70_13601 [Pomacea canaliculata]
MSPDCFNSFTLNVAGLTQLPVTSLPFRLQAVFRRLRTVESPVPTGLDNREGRRRLVVGNCSGPKRACQTLNTTLPTSAADDLNRGGRLANLGLITSWLTYR